jgi:hypothetical protein
MSGLQVMINRVELEHKYSVVVENCPDTQKTRMGVEYWQLVFDTKQEVHNHIMILNKALEFWEYN